MSDVESVIAATRLAIATAEGLMFAIDKAKQALAAGTEQLKDVLAAAEKEAEKARDQLAADRKEADDALDKKFDASKG